MLSAFLFFWFSGGSVFAIGKMEGCRLGRMLIELAAASPDSLEVSQRSSPILKPPVSSIPALCGFALPSLVARSLGARAVAQRATTRSSPGMGINRSGVAPALLRRGKRALACRVATSLPWRPPQLRCLVFSHPQARPPPCAELATRLRQPQASPNRWRMGRGAFTFRSPRET